MRIEFNSESESSDGLRTIIYICERTLAERQARTIPKDAPDALPRYGGTLRENLIQTAAAQAIVEAAARGGVVLDEGTGEPLSEREVEALQRIADGGTGAEAARKAFGGNPQSPPTAASPAVAGVVASNGAGTSTGTAPANASSPTTAIASDAERDAKGVPWDARIHSENKSKNKDQTWRYKRGVDEAVKTAVLAEIAGTVAPVEPSAPNVPTPPPTPAVVVPTPPPNAVSLPSGAVPVPPAAALGVPNAEKPVVVPTPPVNPTANGQAQPSATAVSSAAVGASPSKLTFPALVSKINQGLAGSKITQDDIQLACSELGIPGVAALADPANAHLTDALGAKLFPNG